MGNIRILVKGLMDRDWEDWFSGFTLAYTPAGETILSGHVRDQAELRGMVSRLADLGLELISLETEHSRSGDTQQHDGEIVTGSGRTGMETGASRDKRNTNKKEKKMKNKMSLVTMVVVLVFTSVIVGVVYGRPAPKTDSVEPIQTQASQTADGVIESLQGIDTGDQVKTLYGWTEGPVKPRVFEPTVRPIPGPLTDIDQLKALYGYVEANAGVVIASMTADEIKALYGYDEDRPVNDFAVDWMTTNQVKALYGWTTDPATLRVYEPVVRPIPEPLTDVAQLMALYGYVDTSADGTLTPMTADQIKALYGFIE